MKNPLGLGARRKNQAKKMTYSRRFWVKNSHHSETFQTKSASSIAARVLSVLHQTGVRC